MDPEEEQGAVREWGKNPLLIRCGMGLAPRHNKKKREKTLIP